MLCRRERADRGSRVIPASADAIFEVLRDPEGHVSIDASGMLQSSDGEPAGAVGDSFVVHMDREALGDLDMGGTTSR